MEPKLSTSDILGEHVNNPETLRKDGYPISSTLGQFKIPPLEQRIKGQFEDWLTCNALKAIQDANRLGFPEEADSLRKAFLKKRSAGKYEFGDEVYQEAIGSIVGSSQLLHLLMLRCHPEITLDAVRKLMLDQPKEVTAGIKWSMGNDVAPEAGAGKEKA